MGDPQQFMQLDSKKFQSEDGWPALQKGSTKGIINCFPKAFNTSCMTTWPGVIST